jgi:phosphomannomutase/phosphoglucomutase
MPSTPALPFLFWPIILMGLSASYWVLVFKRRADLEDDVKLILDTADSRDPLTLKHAELSPLALTIRQLASNNRSRMRRSGQAAILPEQSQETSAREPQAPQLIASEWTTGIGSWVRLADSETEAEEQNALKKLAVGIAGLAARSSAQSFVVSCLGGDKEIRAKTCFIKALLSEGVDVIDVGNVPTPIAHMATHNGTSSGAALVLQRDTKDRLTLGALYNRQWVEEGFWQKITALSYEHVATSSNGRSIKLKLEDDYCDRLSADMAMAENLRITVVCDSPITLSITEQSLQKASCDVRSVCVERGFSEHEAQAHFGSYEADLHFVLNSGASRLTVFDAHGNRVRDDHIFMLISRDALARHPGSDVIIGFKGSRVLSSFVTSCGGASKMVDSAPHVLQREMTDSGAIIGGDCDGAFYLRDRWFGSDDAIYAGARLAEIVSNEGPLTRLIAALPETSLSVLPLSDKAPLHDALLVLLSDETSFAGARISQANGIRVDFADSWAHIDDGLASDPTLRFEGDDDSCRARLEELVADLLSQKYPELALPTPLPTMTTSRSP